MAIGDPEELLKKVVMWSLAAFLATVIVLVIVLVGLAVF